MPEQVLLAWSGGKDSTLALAALRADRGIQVTGLLTTVNVEYDRVSIHGVRRSILHAQARALELPLFEARLDPMATNESYERAWAGAVQEARDMLGPVARIAYGDLFLTEVRAFREAQAVRGDYIAEFPLWGRETRALALQFIEARYEAYLTCVDTSQLSADFAGRRFDLALLADLPPTVDPCGERGEFHTCVVAGPLFRNAIAVSVGARVRRDERFEFCDLIPSPQVTSTDDGADRANHPGRQPTLP